MAYLKATGLDLDLPPLSLLRVPIQHCDWPVLPVDAQINPRRSQVRRCARTAESPGRAWPISD